MMLESTLQKDNAFLTLTYKDEKLPDDLSVRPRTISLFNKRLRKRWGRFRFFACGEYGDHSFRPHYHIALFGFPTCAWGVTRKKEYCCTICDAIAKCWPEGFIHLDSLTPASMAYVAGYVTKKMTSQYDPRLEGRRPEFARMSLRPGIGYSVMHEVASTLLEYDLHKHMPDAPYSLQHGSRKWPLGRYLRRNLRCMIGRDPKTPQVIYDEMEKKMRPLRETAFNASIPLKTAVLSASEGRRIQINANERRKKKANRL